MGLRVSSAVLYSLQRSHFPLFDLFDHGGIVLTETCRRTDTLDLTGLLRARRKRPNRRRAAEKGDEFAPSYDQPS